MFPLLDWDPFVGLNRFGLKKLLFMDAGLWTLNSGLGFHRVSGQPSSEYVLLGNWKRERAMDTSS